VTVVLVVAVAAVVVAVDAVDAADAADAAVAAVAVVAGVAGVAVVEIVVEVIAVVERSVEMLRGACSDNCTGQSATYIDHVEPDCFAQRKLSGIARTVDLKFAALA